MKKFKDIEKMIKNLVMGLPMIMTILALVILTILFYTLLGCKIFGKVDLEWEEETLGDYVNFKNVLSASE